MDIILYCNDQFHQGCYWSGAPDELVAIESDPDHFAYCPQCDGNDFQEEEEEYGE